MVLGGNDKPWKTFQAIGQVGTGQAFMAIHDLPRPCWGSEYQRTLDCKPFRWADPFVLATGFATQISQPNSLLNTCMWYTTQVYTAHQTLTNSWNCTSMLEAASREKESLTVIPSTPANSFIVILAWPTLLPSVLLTTCWTNSDKIDTESTVTPLT